MVRRMLGEARDYRVYDVCHGELPRDPAECELYVITGSSAAVYDDLPWIPPLLDFIRATATTVYHPCGTCRMGSDDAAVLDPQLRVRGVDGLRVVDASAMPLVPSSNIQPAVMMLAERAAGLVRG